MTPDHYYVILYIIKYVKCDIKRLTTDAAGYLLILAAALTGWLPGPGGIPLFVAGLGLLSINNEWAKRLRNYLLQNGGKVVQLFFPRNQYISWFYDILVVLLVAFAGFLGYRHAAIWQISVATAAFFFATFIALMNRDRLIQLKNKSKHKHV